MHSRTEPMEEAQRVYVEQASLAERLRSGAASEPLILWDVGLGAAANAIAAIRSHETLASSAVPTRPLRIISFEIDLEPLRLALGHLEKFSYLNRPGPAELLREGRWRAEDSGVSWELSAGDFIETMRDAPAPEVIFYDMFSPKTCGPAWTARTFRSLFAKAGSRSAVLATYTLSTAARAGMLAAGFWVARGRPAGAKAETTVALSPSAVAECESEIRLLGPEWLQRWERSTARFPADIPAEQEAEFARAIRGHPQFHRR